MSGTRWKEVDPLDSELVKRVLRRLCRKGVYLTTTRVQKLFYLIERQSVLDFGRRAFQLDYLYNNFGMYSPALNRILAGLDPKVDHLRVRNVASERGSGRWIDCTATEEGESLPQELEQSVSRVLSEWGFLKTPALISAAKGTSPFIYAKKGEHLDWDSLLEERCQDGEELSEEGRRRLESALRSADAGRCRRFDSAEEVMDYLFS